MAQEILLLHSVRKNFRELWLWSWLLHWGLYLYIAAALLMAASWLLSSAMLSRPAITHAVWLVYPPVWQPGLFFLLTTLLRLRPYTTRAAKFNLLFLAVFFVTGGLSLAGIARQFAQGLNFAALISDASPVLRLHLMLLAFFLVYFPFTHMTHAYMKFFTWHGVRWDDVPAAHVSSTNTVLAGSLGRHVTWSAPHIAGKARRGRKRSPMPRDEEPGAMLKIEDIAGAGGTLGELNPDKLIPLPPPYNKVSDLPKRKQVDPRYEASLDGFSALGFSAPKTAEEEEKFVSAFLSGIEKLLSPDNNWPFLKQLQLSMDHCACCQTCVEACPVYVGSGREEVYRQLFAAKSFAA